MTFALWGAVAHAAEPCTQPAKAAEVSSALEEAMVNYAVLEEEAFEAATDRALRSVECLREPMPPELAAQLHRVVGVRLLMTGDEAGAREALTASARIEPSYKLSATIAPEGGSLDEAWKAALTAGPGTRVPFGRPVTALVDGVSAAERPQTGPYVLQVEDQLGAVAWSGWVKSGWPTLPDGLGGAAPAPAPVAVAPSPAPAPAPAPATASEHHGKGFLIAGLVSGGVAAGLYGTAIGARVAYDGNPTQGGYTVTNGAWYGSIGTAVLSAGLLTVHVVR